MIPKIVDELSTRRVVTSELADGARFAEVAQWSQQERDLAAETIYRFTFRSLYDVHAFNGYCIRYFMVRVTFLDFGLVKHFSADELLAAGGHGPLPVRGAGPGRLPGRHGGRGLPPPRTPR